MKNIIGRFEKKPELVEAIIEFNDDEDYDRIVGLAQYEYYKNLKEYLVVFHKILFFENRGNQRAPYLYAQGDSVMTPNTWTAKKLRRISKKEEAAWLF